MTQQLTIIRPDDWHLHVRDGAALHTVVPHTAAQFGRAIIMPNLKPPVTTAPIAKPRKMNPGTATSRIPSTNPAATHAHHVAQIMTALSAS